MDRQFFFFFYFIRRFIRRKNRSIIDSYFKFERSSKKKKKFPLLGRVMILQTFWESFHCAWVTHNSIIVIMPLSFFAYNFFFLFFLVICVYSTHPITLLSILGINVNSPTPPPPYFTFVHLVSCLCQTYRFDVVATSFTHALYTRSFFSFSSFFLRFSLSFSLYLSIYLSISLSLSISISLSLFFFL